MDVTRLVNSMGEESRRSSILFGIHSENKAISELKRIRRRNCRIGFVAAFAIFLLFSTLICLIVFDVYANANRNKPEAIEEPASAQPWIMTKNVQLDRRWGKEQEETDMNDEESIPVEKHANHRYDPLELEERINSKPRPFHLPKNNSLQINNEFRRPPVRFRGVYIHPEQQPRDPEYYEKINNFFSKPNDGAAQSSDLYTKVLFPTRSSIGDDRTNVKPRRKPFTVMLDIYPMDDDRVRVDVQNKRPFLRYPDPNIAASMQYMHPPKPQRSRMFMKLNLFPKMDQQNRRTWMTRQNNDDDYEEDYEEEEEDDDDDQGDEEENNEDMEHSCNGIVGHNPYGKPISAKWKDKNGAWVHAKYVSLNQWDDRMDPR